MSQDPVLAAKAWPTNGHLIADAARLGYLRDTDVVLDPTYGRGRWWSVWRPEKLVCHDLHTLDGVDFRYLPHLGGEFDVVAFDPPYKLNGRPTAEVDGQYGVDVVMSWQQRHLIIREGMNECTRMLRAGGVLLLKCQAQVCSGAIRWQDVEFTNHGTALGLSLVDRFDLLGKGRPQPSRSRKDGSPSVQQHAYGRPSTLLVFRKVSA